MAMKQFNLEEYLANPSKKIVTRDGKKVKRVLCTDAMGSYPIVVLIENYGGTRDEAIQYTKEGKYFISGKDDKDLFFATEKHEGWINLYKGDNYIGCYVSNPFSSEEKAIEAGKISNSYLKTVKIEWEV